MSHIHFLKGARIIVVVAVVAALAACGGKDTNDIAVDENDGAELVTLMKSLQTAVQNEDQQTFLTLFSDIGTAKTAWRALLKWKWDSGENKIQQLTAYPEIERASTNLHVKRLILTEWFELDRGYSDSGRRLRSAIYQTKWEFSRGESAWQITGFRVSSSSVAYGDIIPELNRMAHFDFESLGMQWQERGDPAPVLSRTLQALGEQDMKALKSCTVDGTLFYAFEKGIEFPSIANDNSVSGKYNRENCAKFLEKQIRNMRAASGELKMNPIDLEPYVTAYRIIKMPANCTKLKILIEFEDPSVPDHVQSFTVSWSAAYVMQKWLAEYVGVETIRWRG
ncbi:MAG: hypothetical protein JSW58_05600 [Candidatus Latescibacterota bacterium]|nr:MAG: hypothetical protein JSW58_05600 [Candidatus Latescibacterota bacterium]